MCRILHFEKNVQQQKPANRLGRGEIAEFREHVIRDMRTPVIVEKPPVRNRGRFAHCVPEYRIADIIHALLVTKAASKDKEIREKVI